MTHAIIFGLAIIIGGFLGVFAYQISPTGRARRAEIKRLKNEIKRLDEETARLRTRMMK